MPTHSERDSAEPSANRTYRLRKRRRPCDRCRDRKLRCPSQGEPPCLRCVQSQTPCTFNGRPRRRQTRRSSAGESDTRGNLEDDQDVVDTSVTRGNTDPPSVGLPQAGEIPQVAATPLENPSPHLTDFGILPPMTQFSQTLDNIKDHTAVLLGGSSESDPWLLRHCRFDEDGLRSFFDLQFRHVGGVPTTDKIPVHFLVTPDALTEGAVAETRIAHTSELRSRLDQLIPAAWGVRLVRLFYKHVFPLLPIISSKYFGPQTFQDLPPHEALDDVPCYLLGAVYGLALPFARNDDHLSLIEITNQLPRDAVWRIVWEGLQEQFHRPHLSVLQAAVFYLHKTSQDKQAYINASTTLRWSLMGSIVGMAHSLGLHLETRMCAIPAEEKQMRRRVWWAIYIEDKWLSLLLGRPPYIHQEEWDVSNLDERDFGPPSYVPFSNASLVEVAAPFRDMARLAVIAGCVQSSFYSLKACQLLSEDLSASIDTAKPIFDQLGAWRATISAPEAPWTSLNSGTESDYPATVYLAYVTLVAYVWRALLRPTTLSEPPPLIVDLDQPLEDSLDMSHDNIHLGAMSWELPNLSDIQLPLADATVDTSETIRELHQASLSWAASLVNLASHLSPADFGEFWYSWSASCFAVISNFAMVIFIQSPSAEAATKSKDMLDNWRRVVRNQSKVSPLLLLALARINGFFVAGLSELFRLPMHVEAAISRGARGPT